MPPKRWLPTLPSHLEPMSTVRKLQAICNHNIMTHYNALASETGASALLLLISGTIPVQFRGTTYRFPIAIWVPHEYPKESPMVYVTPAPGMLVRPGQHVAVDGRVYHPYLAGWSKYWDVSSPHGWNLGMMLIISKEIFDNRFLDGTARRLCKRASCSFFGTNVTTTPATGCTSARSSSASRMAKISTTTPIRRWRTGTI
jgi:hypothetical protein